MRRPIIMAAFAVACVAEGAVAACSSPAATQVVDADLTTLLSGNTVCAIQGGERWQEEHHANGELWDYKRGDGHPVDPRTRVGRWSVTNAVVTHDYGGGAQYSYEVWDDGGTYSFCQAGVVDLDNVSVVTGINRGCP